MRYRVLTKISQIEAGAWDALVPAGDPFVAHAFLAALESSGSVGPPATGWLPRHLVLEDDGRLVAAMPLYEKHDSMGEFVFDWAWADAAHRAGIAYYPKLVAAVPFTPVAGARLLAAPELDLETAVALLVGAAGTLAERLGASGLHVLFCPDDLAHLLAARGFVTRSSLQFHWHKDPSWGCYEDFVASLRAPARKQLRRERARGQGHGLALAMQPGDQLDAAAWRALERFYRSTSADKGGTAYLTSEFFAHLRGAMADQIVAALAYRGQQAVAGALFFRHGSALFGRYWGADEPLDALHFELCYHLPVAWAFDHGVDRIEAGAQGIHKHKRGFLPTACTSAHALAHPGLHAAVAQACQQEAEAFAAGITELRGHSPYQRGPSA